MIFKVTLTEEDFLKAAYVHGRRWLWRFALPYFGILSVLMFWITSRSAGLGTMFQLGFMVFLIAVLIYKWFVQFPARTRKHYRQQVETQGELTCEIGEEAFGMEHKNGHFKKPWGEFRRWRGTDEFILLYPTDNAYFVIPRRCLDAEEWKAAVVRVGEKVGG